MTAAEIMAQVPALACMVVTAAAFTAAGAWRGPRDPGGGDSRRRVPWKVLVPVILGAFVTAAVVLLAPGKPTSPDAAIPHASYGPGNAMFQLAINAALVAPFVAWVAWRRSGAAAFGVGKPDLLPSLAVGACVSLACIAMLGPVSGSFWSSPGTWWLLVAMLGVGASEELVFRGLLLGSLSKRLPRAAAEATSAAIFAAVHLPQRVASGMAMADAAVSLSVLFVWGWCYAVAMRAGRNVPGLALVHAVTNVCV